jgi:hypothetical protein
MMQMPVLIDLSNSVLTERLKHNSISISPVFSTVGIFGRNKFKITEIFAHEI